MRVSKDYGWIPDEIQAQEAKKAGVQSDRDFILSMAKTLSDPESVPEVWDFEDFVTQTEKLPDARFTAWWDMKLPNGELAGTLLTGNQGQLPNCAGVSAANAVSLAEVLQNMNRFGESIPQKFNPLGTWQMTKNGSRNGGQTISAMAEGIRSVGSCLAEDLGEYSDRQNFRVLDDTTLENASKHQAGVAVYEEGTLSREALCEKIFMLCRKGFAGFLGCVNALADGVQEDSNGVPVLTLSGEKWAHAMAIAGWLKAGGTEYVAIINSHGNIYRQSKFQLPAHCGFISLPDFKRLASGTWFDFCAITNAEGKYDVTGSKTLNPWKIHV